MDAGKRAREERKRKLLKELAQLNLDDMAEEGVFDDTPHFSAIEQAAREVGQQLSRETQEQAAREVAANCDSHEACPACGESSPVQTKRRTVASVDGPVELLEPVAYCRRCRRSFFPSTESNGPG